MWLLIQERFLTDRIVSAIMLTKEREEVTLKPSFASAYFTH